MMKKSWVGIEVSCENKVTEDLAAEVAEAFGVGVEIGEGLVRFYLEGSEFLDEWELQLRHLLDEAAGTYHAVEPFLFRTFVLADEGWADSWRAYFRPFRIGKRFLVCPTWEECSSEAGDLVIVMDPGRAFGTGHHETTRLCLEWMERWTKGRDLAPLSLLDVGTGSGVLAIAAALLGFGKVIGIDNDPEAIEVAIENVGLNGLIGRVEIEEATVSGVVGGSDVVIANIQALPLIRMARELSGRLKEDGRLVLSGILLEQRDEVVDAFQRFGLKLTESEAAGEWVSLVFEKETTEKG